MAASYNLFLAIFLLAMLMCHCEADSINNVCSKSRNPAFCDRALRSDPRSKGADLKGLGEIIIEKAISGVHIASNVANSVKTPKNKNIIAVCIQTQNEAVDSLNNCKTLLKSAKDRSAKETLKMHASAALTNVGTCDDEFEDTKTQPAKLQQASKYAQDLISILLVIVN